MATTFSLKLNGEDEEHTQYVADLCIRRIDELESKLSRFIPDSDISRINRLKEGESVMVDFETHECLKQAISTSVSTQGHFDVGTAELMNIYRGYQQGILNDFEYGQAIETALIEKSKASLYVSPDKMQVTCVNTGMKIDLGGIGKGYTLDELRKVCIENDIGSYHLDAGGSTVLLGKGAPWPFKLTSKKQQIDLMLSNTSVSASGSAQQGDHIFDPSTGENNLRRYDRLWICCKTATLSDAYGTAFYTMIEEEIEEVVNQIKEIKWVAFSKEGTIHFLHQKEEQLI